MKRFMIMTGYELKKAFGNRLLLIFLLICIAVNAVICYMSTERDEAYFYLEKIAEDYAADPEGVKKYYDGLLAYRSTFEELMIAYMKGQISEEPKPDYPCTYSGSKELDDFYLLNRFFSAAGDDGGFKATIGGVVENAKINQIELLTSYAGITEESYAFKKQKLVENVYTEIYNNAVISAAPVYGWDQFFDFDSINIFILLPVIAGAAAVFLADMGNASLILRVSKKGRGHTALAKISALLLWTCIVTLLLLGATFLTVLIKCGAYSDPLHYISAFKRYELMPLCLTVIGFLLVFVLVKLLLFFAVSMVSAFFFLAVRNVSIGFVCSLFIFGISYYRYSSDATEVGKYLNFVGIGCFTNMVRVFRCINVAEEAVLFLPLALCLLLTVLAVFLVLVFLLFTFSRLTSAYKLPFVSYIKGFFAKFNGFGGTFKSRVGRFKRTRGSMLFYEFRKSCMNRGFLIILVAFSLLKMFSASDAFSKKNSYSMTIYEDYMEILAGEQSEEKKEYIASEQQYIAEITGEYADKRNAYISGNISYDEYIDFLTEYNYALDREELVKKIADHSVYIDGIEQDTGVNAHYMYDLDWVRIFEAGADILLLALTVYVASGIFSDEYGKDFGRDGILSIVRMTKKGRAILFNRKLAFSLLFALAVGSLFTFCDVYHIYKNLKLPNGGSPLLSLEMFSGAVTDISLIGFAVISVIVKLLALLTVSVTVTMLGVLIKNKLYALISSFVITFAPYLLYSFGIKAFRYVDVLGAVDFDRLYLISVYTHLGSDLGFALIFLAAMVLLSAVLTIMAKKEFIK